MSQDQFDKEEIQNALVDWLSNDVNGQDLTARELRPDWPEERLKELERRISDLRAGEQKAARDKEMQDALDSWQEHYENGEDRTVRELRPDWPEERLKELERKISALRGVLQMEDALDSWQEHYENGEDLTARELRPEWPEEGLKKLDWRISARRDGLQMEDDLDSWQEHYENGEDRTAQELRPEWPGERLNELDRRISLRRAGFQAAARGDTFDTVEESILRLRQFVDEAQRGNLGLGFKIGDRVKGTDFILEDFLGSGGFGEVWKATSRYLPDQFVALKFCLRSEDAASLKNEAALLNRIQKECCDDGFVKILATHIDHSPPFVVYEYVGGDGKNEGGNLYDYLENRFRTKGPYSFIEAAQIMLEILRPMVVAHTRTPRIAHRDLKPHNILVAHSDCFPPKLKIADFGLGGLSMKSSIAASRCGKHIAGRTPAYASQEQMADEDRKPNTSDDVHALGVIWYELLSGKLLQGRPSGTGWRKMLAEGLTEEQIAFLQSCFDDEAQRPKDAVAMANVIEKFLPSIEENILEDMDEIWRLRKAGNDWRGYIRSVARERTAIWLQAARQGASDAQWLIAICLEMQLEIDGQASNVPSFTFLNYGEAAKWFTMAAERGNGEAQYSLACYHRLGLGNLKRDEQESVRWLEKAAASGQGDALYELGLMQMKSEDKLANVVGVNWLLRAARGGHAEAKVWFCAREMHHFRGMEFIRPYYFTYFSACNQSKLLGGALDRPPMDQCLGWLRETALRGHNEAQFLLGKYCENNVKTVSSRSDEEDRAAVNEAIKWYRKAAEGGHLEAQFRLSQCLRSRRYFLVLDTLDALDILPVNPGEYCEKREIMYGHEPELAVLETELLMWWMLAAKRGLADAQFTLAYMFDPTETHSVVEWLFMFVTDAEFFAWLSEAVLQGHYDAVAYLLNPDSSHLVGSFLKSPSLYPRIVEALEHAAEQGNADAAFFFANAYSKGDMGIRDCVKASKWLQEAARLGNEQAVRMILDGLHAVPDEEPEAAVDTTPWHWLAKDKWTGPNNEAKAEVYFRSAEELFEQITDPMPFGKDARTKGRAASLYLAAALKGHGEAGKRLAELHSIKSGPAITALFRAD